MYFDEVEFTKAIGGFRYDGYRELDDCIMASFFIDADESLNAWEEFQSSERYIKSKVNFWDWFIQTKIGIKEFRGASGKYSHKFLYYQVYVSFEREDVDGFKSIEEVLR